MTADQLRDGATYRCRDGIDRKIVRIDNGVIVFASALKRKPSWSKTLRYWGADMFASKVNDEKPVNNKITYSES